jgi:hypothetical protein
MGLFDAMRAERMQLKGMSIVDANGVEVQRITDRTFSAGRLDSDDIEIFRTDLCALLADGTRDVEYVLNDGTGYVELRTRIETGQVELVFVPIDGSEPLWIARTPAAS